MLDSRVWPFLALFGCLISELCLTGTTWSVCTKLNRLNDLRGRIRVHLGHASAAGSAAATGELVKGKDGVACSCQQ